MNNDVKICQRCGQFYVTPCGAESIPQRPIPPATRKERDNSGCAFSILLAVVLFLLVLLV